MWKLVERISRVCNAVIEAKGGCLKSEMLIPNENGNLKVEVLLTKVYFGSTNLNINLALFGHAHPLYFTTNT